MNKRAKDSTDLTVLNKCESFLMIGTFLATICPSPNNATLVLC